MMTTTTDRKMFAPLWRGQALSPEAKLVAMLRIYEAGATVAGLSNELGCAGLAVGSRAALEKRVGELLDELEQGGGVERTPDGRYRATREVRST